MPIVEAVPLHTKNPLLRLVFWACRRRLGRVIEPLRGYARSGWVLVGSVVLELAFERAHRVPSPLKKLAELRVASLVGCAFCIDIGSSIVRQAGVAPEKLRELHRWQTSDRFTDDERLVLAYADRLTKVPVPHDDEEVARLRARFSDAQIVELTAAIAHENFRARMNHGLGYGSEGFSEGAACALPVAAEASA